jgi:hypothetical protein
MLSTHTTKLPINGLSDDAKTAHILPDIKTNLVSIAQIVDDGCEATFNTTNENITRNNKIILTGPRSKETGLWHLNLTSPTSEPISPPSPMTTDENICYYVTTAISSRTYTSPKELIAYYHACAGYPVLSTWRTAIKNGNFKSWPHLTEQAVLKYPHISIVMHKDHMQQQRQGLHSTKPKSITKPDLINKEEKDFLHISSRQLTATCVEITGKMYADATGRFTTASITAKKYHLVFYK